jgi:hypothetical protein
MNKIRLLVISGVLVTLVFFSACEKTVIPENNEAQGEDPADYEWDSTQVVRIALNSVSITVEPDVAEVSGSVVIISKAGTYSISGSLSDGQIIVNTEESGPVRLVLDGVNIKCTSSAPVYIQKAEKVIIILNEGKQNYLGDGTSYNLVDNEPGAALFSNSYLAISGTGSLSVTANFRDGISSDDELIIDNGTISVTAADNGIRGKDYLYIRDGKITVTSKGDGLKSDNSNDLSLGYIIIDTCNISITTTAGDGINASTSLKINNGTFNIITGGGAGTISTGGGGFPGGGGTSGYSGTESEKALKATGEIEILKGVFTLNSADDAIHSGSKITIQNGSYSIASGDDAFHSDVSVTVNGGTIDVTKCYEAMEGPSITINGGNISMVSTDDTFNATKGTATESSDGSLLAITGGTIFASTSKGDCIDSNGNVTMSGGVLIAHGPSSAPEVGADVNGTFKVTGGFLLFTGPNSGNMIEGISNSSTQNCLKTTFSSYLSASSLFHIQDAGGKNILTFKPVRNVYYIVLCTSDLKTGSTYSIYTGGTSTGIFTNGLYMEGTYSGGTLRKNITITGVLTNVSI